MPFNSGVRPSSMSYFRSSLASNNLLSPHIQATPYLQQLEDNSHVVTSFANHGYGTATMMQGRWIGLDTQDPRGSDVGNRETRISRGYMTPRLADQPFDLLQQNSTCPLEHPDSDSAMSSGLYQSPRDAADHMQNLFATAGASGSGALMLVDLPRLSSSQRTAAPQSQPPLRMEERRNSLAGTEYLGKIQISSGHVVGVSANALHYVWTAWRDLRPTTRKSFGARRESAAMYFTVEWNINCSSILTASARLPVAAIEAQGDPSINL